MRALQLEYTSCRRGTTGGAGFQTRTASPGLRDDERHEIERRGVYRPPRDAAPAPTDEEIRAEFPCAFRSYRLESGRWAVTRSRYVGRDYTGRWGNFFAHTLVGEEPAAPRLWPVDLYEWPGWRDGLAPDEDTDARPEPLASVDLESAIAGPSFQLAELQEFLRERPERVRLLPRLIRAMLSWDESSRAVVVRDTVTSGLFWIACLQKALPLAHAWSISWSSYQDDPRGCARVNLTCGETDFAFDDAERRYRFYAFDLQAGIQSDVPDEPGDYGDVVARWMVEAPDALAAFHDFMLAIDHVEVGPGLLTAVKLFELARGRTFESGELTGILTFGDQHVTARGRAPLVQGLVKALGDGLELRRPEDHGRVIAFIGRSASAMDADEHAAALYTAWRRLVERHVLCGDGGVSAAESAWGELLTAPGCRAIADRLLTDPLLDQPPADLARLNVAALALLLRCVRRALGALGRGPTSGQPQVAALVLGLLERPEGLERAARSALEAVGDDVSDVAGTVRLLVRLACEGGGEAVPVERAVGRGLTAVLAALPAQARSRACAALARDHPDVLIGACLSACDSSTSPDAAWEEQRAALEADAPDVLRRHEPELAWHALERLPAARRPAVALRWLRAAHPVASAGAHAAACVRLANEAVAFDDDAPAADETAAAVRTAARGLRIQLVPDRPLLHEALATVRRAKPGGSGRALALEAAVAALPLPEYERYLEAYLPPALGQVRDVSGHAALLNRLVRKDGLSQLSVVYRKTLAERRRDAGDPALRAALLHWLTRGPSDTHWQRVPDLRAALRPGLVAALARLKPRQVTQLHAALKKAGLAPGGQHRWTELTCDLQPRQPWVLAWLLERWRG